MQSETYKVKITGTTPLLMHFDNVEWADQMEAWRMVPENKAKSKAGDDRTPAFTWIGSLYHENGEVVMPSDNLMTMMREGGAKCPTGKRGATFKRQTQSGIIVDQVSWPLMNTDGAIYTAKGIDALLKESDFLKHQKYTHDNGYELFVKRAKIGQSKHIRVRPRFNSWMCAGTVTVLDETITKDVLRMILEMGGMLAGLCDWRPSSPRSPGSFGKFTVEVS